MELASLYDRKRIFPERSIKYYNLSKLVKERIDIVLETENKTAFELKMPMNGQVPEQMFKFIQDIKFLEELKSIGKFSEGYLITVTNDQNFWNGRNQDGIYSYFRSTKIITGKICKPTGEDRNKVFHEIDGEYNVQWNNLNNCFRYFLIKI